MNDEPYADQHLERLAAVAPVAWAALRQTDDVSGLLSGLAELSEDDLRALVQELTPTETYYLARILDVDLGR